MTKINEDGVIRDMTEAELAQYEADKAEAKAQTKADAEKAKLKTATFTKLGLTADEVAALLS